jgi:hypothetical protein
MHRYHLDDRQMLIIRLDETLMQTGTNAPPRTRIMKTNPVQNAPTTPTTSGHAALLGSRSSLPLFADIMYIRAQRARGEDPMVLRRFTCCASSAGHEPALPCCHTSYRLEFPRVLF